MRRPARFSAAGTLLLALALPLAAAAANDEDDFYRGKTMSLIIPIGPGGAYDTYSRLVGRYLGKYLPGKAWALVLRATLIRGPEVRLSVAGLSSFYEVLTTMAAGVLLAALLFGLQVPSNLVFRHEGY